MSLQGKINNPVGQSSGKIVALLHGCPKDVAGCQCAEGKIDKGSAQYDTCDQKPKAGLRKAPDLLRRALYHTIV